MTRIFINSTASPNGGPHVWSQRFIKALTHRGYQVANQLESEWAAALFINQSDGIEIALKSQKTVAFRVAGCYQPEWFRRMGRKMQRQHHAANAAIASALELSDVVIYQSEWAKNTLDQNLYARDFRYEIIQNGVDLSEFSPADAMRNEIPIIGTAGRLRYRYRLTTYFEMSLQLDIPHKLLIVGEMDGECQTVFKQYMSNPILKKRTTYIGYLSPDQLPDIYRKMQVLVHPVCGDICPNVVIEAMACGVPVVTPSYGGTSELVGAAGVIFEAEAWNYDTNFVQRMSTAVQSCLEKIDVLASLSRKTALEKFDIQKMTDRYLMALGLPLTDSETDRHPQEQEALVSLRGMASKWIHKPRYISSMVVRRINLARPHRRLDRPNQKQRIAFNLYDFQLGGIENWLFRLANQLQQEFEFHFLATKIPNASPKFHQIGAFAYLPGPISMMRYLNENRIDIVQVHNERWPADAALAAGVRHVIERTDGTRSCNRVPKHGFDLVIASSNGTIPLIAQTFPAEKIRLVYNGIDLSEIDNAVIRRLWGKEEFVIGRASRFGRGKNLPILIEAFKRLVEKHPRSRLIIIGGDSPLPGAESLAMELHNLIANYENSMRIMGFEEDPLPWTKGFDVGTCVSLPGNEGIPNSLLEAMACSKPVISTDVDQVNELVVDGYNGLLIPPDNIDALVEALLKLIEDPNICKELGTAGRQTVADKFSLQESSRMYAEIYHDLLSS